MTEGSGVILWGFAALIIGPTSIVAALMHGLLAGLAVYVLLFAAALLGAWMGTQSNHTKKAH